MEAKVLSMEKQTLWANFHVPGVWAEDNPPGMARFIPPVEVQVKPGMQPIHVKQFYLPRESIIGVQEPLKRLLKYGIIRPCQQLGILRWMVNQATVSLHPVMPNPYILMGLVPAEANHFTTLDLKDAFF